MTSTVALDAYATAESADTFATYRDRHDGKSIIVCGCGASLPELVEPRRFVTIGVNDVGRLFDPTYLVVINPRRQFSPERFRAIEHSRADAVFTHLDLGLERPTVRFRLGRHGGTAPESDALPHTRNSPYLAVALAMHLGARRIGLIGVDFTEDHFFGATGSHPLSGRLAEIDAEYAALAAACRYRDIDLINLSPRSRLTALPKTDVASFAANENVVCAKPAAASPPRVFVVTYQFLSCGDVFTRGLRTAAQQLGVVFADAPWDTPQLHQQIAAFEPDLVLVVHGRKFVRRWGSALRRFNTAVWLLDEPYEVDDTASWSRTFRTVFVNDPSTLSRHVNAHYVPVAHDPMLHYDDGGERFHAVGFVGGGNPTRERWLDALVEHNLLSYVVGGPWRSQRLGRLCLASNITATETAELYRHTRIIVNVFRDRHHFNCHGAVAVSSNPRIHEALACGALVVSEWRPGISEIYPELPTVHNADKLAATVEALLGDEARARAILADCTWRLSAHTYATRLETMLRIACSGKANLPLVAPIAMPTASSDTDPASIAVTALAPAGWHRTVGSIECDRDILFFVPTDGGDATGIASDRALTEAVLSATLRLSADAVFLARLHSERADDPDANSYHLVASRSGDYLAKHHRVLARFTLPRDRCFAFTFRRPNHAELSVTVDGQLVAAVHDHQLQSGFAGIEVSAGRVEVHALAFASASATPTSRARSFVKTPSTHSAHPNHSPTPALSRRVSIAALPFSRVPRRNLIYHVWPVRDSLWRWNLEQLKRRIDLFDGKRVIAIVRDARSEPAEAVKEALDGHGCSFIVRDNGPAGEALTFPELLREVRSTDPDELTFYGHAKGVKYGAVTPEPVRKWTEALYRVNLDDWSRVAEALTSHAVAGSFRLLGRFSAHRRLAPWHFSGTFFWLRHVHVFSRPDLHVPRFYGGVETWPGLHFAREETACLFLDGLRQLPYDPDFWSSVGDPSLAAWERARHAIPVPADLLQPPPFAGHAVPRLEQKHDEFAWFLSRMLSADVRRILTIGAMHGGVEWHLARVFREAGKSIDITVVELSPGEDARRSFRDVTERFKQTIRLVAGNSTAGETRTQLDATYDAVFIDGDHSYRGAAADWELALSRHPQVIGLHDIADSDWHIAAHCCVSRLWNALRCEHRTEERIEGEWGGIGLVWL